MLASSDYCAKSYMWTQEYHICIQLNQTVKHSAVSVIALRCIILQIQCLTRRYVQGYLLNTLHSIYLSGKISA